MTSKVTIVDYGTSNLLSVCRAIAHCGAQTEFTDDPAVIAKATRLVLPGVGAFAASVDRLFRHNLVEPIQDFIFSGRPFLGICVGMQMMLDGSEEFGWHQGLGLIPGRVKAVPGSDTEGRRHKIPHIGWNALQPTGSPNRWRNTLLHGIEPGSSVYYVHSFTAWPEKEGQRIADSIYGGHRVCAMLNQDNVYGCQFHPEKSGPVGLRILQNFLALG